MKNIFKSLLYILSLSIVVSCHDDLNQSPIDPDSFTEENVFASVNEAKGALAKLYASLALTDKMVLPEAQILQILTKGSHNSQECYLI